MKKPNRPSMQPAVLADLTEHIMLKVSEAAEDVTQLVDTDEEIISLHISAMLALLTNAILNAAPRTATRAEMTMAAKLVTNTVVKKFSNSLDDLSDREIGDAVRWRE